MPSLEQLVQELREIGAKARDIFIPGVLYDRLIEDAEDSLDEDQDNTSDED